MTEQTARSARADRSKDLDRAIGAAVRKRREELRMTQDGLAKAIGVTFQQVQKYERGVNRVAASTLFDIAEALNSFPAAFFPGWEASEVVTDQTMSSSPEGRFIVRNFHRLSPKGRKAAQVAVKAICHVDLPERTSEEVQMDREAMRVWLGLPG